MLADILGDKVQELDLKIVETMKSQQELMIELDNLQSSDRFLVLVKRVSVLSKNLNDTFDRWNNFIIND